MSVVWNYIGIIKDQIVFTPTVGWPFLSTMKHVIATRDHFLTVLPGKWGNVERGKGNE